jgi:hypothetical protein
MDKQVWYLHQIINFWYFNFKLFKKKHPLKFFRQNNYTEKAKILYFLNFVYFLSLVGLWQNHVLYWPLTGFIWRNRTPFGKRVVNMKSKHFCLFNYVPHLFVLTCVKFHGKKIDNNNTLTHICLLPFFRMASYYVI